jgi:hypothetical protein
MDDSLTTSDVPIFLGYDLPDRSEDAATAYDRPAPEQFAQFVHGALLGSTFHGNAASRLSS